jgi:nitrile hydratase
LCSCYPRNLLGLPPDWYKSRAYRSRTVKEPRKVLSEFGVNLPNDTQIRVHDSTADMRYVVIPARPSGSEDLSEEDLAKLVTRDSMIGTGLAMMPNA